jgi:hypothetical protein
MTTILNYIFPGHTSLRVGTAAKDVKQSINKYQVSRPISSDLTRGVLLQYGLNSVKNNGLALCEVQASGFQSVRDVAYYGVSENCAILTDDVFSMRKEASFYVCYVEHDCFIEIRLLNLTKP